MGRPKGSKDKQKRKYNPNSGKNGNRNIYKTPSIAIGMVTLDPKVPRDARMKLSTQALPELSEKVAAKMRSFGYTVLTDQFWEESDKRRAVHCHFLVGRVVQNATQLHSCFYPRRPGGTPTESMKRTICHYAKYYNQEKPGTFGTWKLRLFQDPDVLFTNPKTCLPWADSMPYLDKPADYLKTIVYHRIPFKALEIEK